MRLPSTSQVVVELKQLVRRYPAVLPLVLMATIGGVIFVDNEDHESVAMRIWLVGLLGLPVAFALTLWQERAQRQGVFLAGLAVLAILLGWVFLAWPTWSESIAWRRFLQLLLAGHLLAAFLPFLGRSEGNGFWQYNRLLLQRFLLVTIYAGVLHIGLSIALLALDNLLGLKIEDETYLRLFMLVFFLFHPLWFLGGVPRDLSALDGNHDYPRVLRIFSQYILLPLVSVYLLILTAYLVKVVATWVWPSGWIGYLVSSVCTVGVVSILLLQPLRERGTSAWVGIYCRGFYLAILPSLVMLLMAIGRRIGQYGITENRYFLLVLALWMTGVAIVYGFTRKTTIRLIPVSLFFVVLITTAGPWGAYQVSKRSQISRLSTLLESNNLLVADRLQPATREVGFEDSKELSALMSYLLSIHGAEPLRTWSGASWSDLDTLQSWPLNRGEANDLAARILESLNLEFVYGWEHPGGADQYYFNAENRTVGFVISGYDYAITLTNTLPVIFQLDGADFRLRSDEKAGTLLLESVGGEGQEEHLDPAPGEDPERQYRPVLEISLVEVVEALREHDAGRVGSAPPWQLRLTGDQILLADVEALLVIQHLSTTQDVEDSVPSLSTIRGDLYLHLPGSD